MTPPLATYRLQLGPNLSFDNAAGWRPIWPRSASVIATLEQLDGAFVIRYHETLLPVSPSSYGRILSHRIEALQAVLGPDDPALVELKAVTTWLVTLPIRPENDPEALATRRRHRDLGRRRLAALLERSAPVRGFIEENVRLINGTGDPRSFDLLDTLLADQAYRFAFWRVSSAFKS